MSQTCTIEKLNVAGLSTAIALPLENYCRSVGSCELVQVTALPRCRPILVFPLQQLHISHFRLSRETVQAARYSAVCGVQCAVCGVQCAVCGVQFSPV